MPPRRLPRSAAITTQTSLELLAILTRMADALERLAPPAPSTSVPPGSQAYVWVHQRLRTVATPRAQPLDCFQGVDGQKAALLENSRRLALGLPAHDVLLWGSRGMGKSSLVKAVHAALHGVGTGLALVQVARDDIGSLPALFAQLGHDPRAFLVFADDLSFEADEAQYKALRSVLEGGVEARPDNVRIVVTSNRRHLVARDMSENASFARAHDTAASGAINARDVIDDRLALADRFGLSLGFHACDQPTYLAMVAGYGQTYGLTVEPAEALTWATGRGGRSGRVAWQYIQEVAGRDGVRLAVPVSG